MKKTKASKSDVPQEMKKLDERVRRVTAAKHLVWLDRVTAAAYVGISTNYLDLLVKRQSIPTSRLGQRIIIKRQDLDDYLRQCCPRFSSPVKSKRAAPSPQNVPADGACHTA